MTKFMREGGVEIGQRLITGMFPQLKMFIIKKKSKLTVMALMEVLSKVHATFSLLKDIDAYIFNSSHGISLQISAFITVFVITSAPMITFSEF